MQEATAAAPRAPQPPPLAHPPHTSPVGITLISHPTARPSVAIAAAAMSTAARRPATIPVATAAVTISLCTDGTRDAVKVL